MNNKMFNKPEQFQNKYFEYLDIKNYIENKYNINFNDYLNSEQYKDKWCKENGNISLTATPRHYGGKYYAWINLKGNNVEVTEEEYKKQWKNYYDIYAKYRKWIETQPNIEKLDYDKYMSSRDFSEIRNGSFCHWFLKEIIEDSNNPN